MRGGVFERVENGFFVVVSKNKNGGVMSRHKRKNLFLYFSEGLFSDNFGDVSFDTFNDVDEFEEDDKKDDKSDENEGVEITSQSEIFG